MASKQRSPGYPALSLSDAIEKVRNVYEKEYTHSINRALLAERMGYKSLNGASLTAISALIKYGLLEGRGELHVTPLAVTILAEPKGSKGRQNAIRAAAELPTLFVQLVKHYGERIPTVENASAYLQKNKFTPRAASVAAQVFRDTMQFVSQEGLVEEAETNGEGPSLKVGDYVQWESQGALQFEAPRKVTSLSDDGEYAFVEGTSNGIPMAQLQSAVGPPGVDKMKAPPPMVPGISREVSSLEEGEAILQWPASLSPDSVQELEDWLDLVKKKLKRRYG